MAESSGSDPDDRRRANLDLLGRAFGFIGAGDADGLGSCYAQDMTLELPYARPEPKRVEGRDAVVAYLRAAFEVFRFELELTEVYPSTDPDLLVAEYRSEGRVLATGRRYANSYVGVWRFADGRICGTREWYDPIRAAEAMTPVPDREDAT